MKSVFIVLTTKCDRSEECAHCFYNVEPDRHVPNRLDTETVKSFLKKMRLLNVPNIYMTGGEPLLREDIELLVARSREMGLNTFLLSNGASLDVERAKRLDASGLDVFVLSLSSLDHKEIKSIHNVRKLKRANFSFIFVLRSDNLDKIPDVLEMVQSLRVGVVFQPVYLPKDNPIYDELSLSKIGPFEWSSLYTTLRGWSVGFGFEDYLRLMHDFYNKKTMKPSSCKMGRDAFVLDADGSVYPCFHRRDLLCGNIHEDDIGAIFSNLEKTERTLAAAPCFGEHCISLHTGFRDSN